MAVAADEEEDSSKRCLGRIVPRAFSPSDDGAPLRDKLFGLERKKREERGVERRNKGRNEGKQRRKEGNHQYNGSCIM